MTSLCEGIRFTGKWGLGRNSERRLTGIIIIIIIIDYLFLRWGGCKETDMLFDTYTGKDLAT